MFDPEHIIVTGKTGKYFTAKYYTENFCCISMRYEYLGLPKVNISVTKSGEEDLHSNLHFLGRCNLYFLYYKGFSCFPCHSSCIYNSSKLLIFELLQLTKHDICQSLLFTYIICCEIFYLICVKQVISI